METRDLMKNAAPMMLALIVTIGFFGFIYLLFVSNEIPKENAAQLNILLGGIGVVWSKAVGFFYDSSASSKAKDEALSAIAQSNPTPSKGSPVVIQNAESVKNETKEGDINVTPKEKAP